MLEFKSIQNDSKESKIEVYDLSFLLKGERDKVFILYV